MVNLALALTSRGDVGEPLPPVFTGLATYGAHIRRGQLTLVAAGSGVGKSSLLTFIAMAMEGEDGRIPTLYFSADSDVMTFGMRTGAMIADIRLFEAERLIRVGDTNFLQQIQRETQHIWVCFEPSPSPKDIEDEVTAYALVNGQYPELIVIDNLMDVKTGMAKGEGDDAALSFLKQLAGRTGAAVVALCHVVAGTMRKDDSGKSQYVDYVNGTAPIPLSGLMNKIDKRPRLILSLYKETETLLGVCILKNSNGRADPDGNLRIFIPFLREKMWFKR
jgi:hypothetical protein